MFLLTIFMLCHKISCGELINMTTDKSNNPIKPVRRPIQSRGISTKEKILQAALELFCEKGFYKTTTNEIAQRAKVSIGSLYSYFEDKDTIILEILERYHNKFEIAVGEALNNNELLETDVRAWLNSLIENLIRVHEETKELNRELNVLSYYNPRIAEILWENKLKTMTAAMEYIIRFKKNPEINDVDATATVAFDMISATVDRIVFEKNEIDRKRLINAATDIIYKYFVL